MKFKTFLILLLAAGAIAGFLIGYGLERSRLSAAAGKKDAKILLVGDIMLDRTMRKVGEEKGYPELFKCVKDYLSGFDLVAANLEGPVTPHESVSVDTAPNQPGNTTFTFSPDAATALAAANIKMVSLGNNHIFDFGREGVESTASFLGKNGISYFGAPTGDIANAVEVAGNKIAFVNFNQFGNGDPEKTLAAIVDAKAKDDYVVVYTHWGEEYQPATDYEKNLAHRFVDAGADIVVGSHPHVIQENETYNGKPIYYSLGNFVFDQYWNDEVRTGEGVELTVNGKDATIAAKKFTAGPGERTCLVTE